MNNQETAFILLESQLYKRANKLQPSTTKDLDSYVEEILDHTDRVFNLCELFWQECEKTKIITLNKNLLFNAAILHDIAKLNDARDHNCRWVVKDVVKKARKRTGVKKIKQMKPIRRIIEAHKNKFDPPSDYAFEAAVLRICDKLDKLNKAETKRERKKAIDKCNKSIAKISKYCNGKNVEGFLELYRVYLKFV